MLPVPVLAPLPILPCYLFLLGAVSVTQSWSHSGKAEQPPDSPEGTVVAESQSLSQHLSATDNCSCIASCTCVLGCPLGVSCLLPLTLAGNVSSILIALP